jgi:hypothetical protein
MKKFFSLLLILTAMLAITPKAEAGPRIAVNLNIPIGGVGFGFCPPVYCAEEPKRYPEYVVEPPQPKFYPQYVVDPPVFVERPVVIERPYVVTTPSANRQVLQVQAVLKNKGYYNKIVDGVFGQETQIAIRNFQLDSGMTVTGRIDSNLIQAIGLR